MTGLDISRRADALCRRRAAAAGGADRKRAERIKRVSRCRYGRCAQQAAGGACLTAMIKKFWDTRDEEESTMTSVDSAKAQTILDTAMLEQYIDLVGPKLITDGLAVFEKMMPGYLSVLEST
jgi:hypothetical protein